MSHLSRRDFSKLALAALPAAGVLPLIQSLRAAESATSAAAPAAKPNSKVRGVQIGLNVPYNFGNNNMPGDEVLARCLQLGASAVELRSQPVEAFMGAPTAAAGGRGGGVQVPGATAAQQAELAVLGASTLELSVAVTAARNALIAASLKSPSIRAEIVEKSTTLSAAELKLAQARADWLARVQASPERLQPTQLAAVLQSNGGPAPAGGRGGRGGAGDELNLWRATASMDRARAFRKMYEDAGVMIEIVKFDNMYAMPDNALDYAFALTRALGGRAISCEISTQESDLRRVGAFADRHQMMVGYHGHAAVTPEIWEAAFSYAKFNSANVDLGHFVAGNNKSPVDFIKKYPDRITHIHIKDRKLNGGPNVPFGEGDTPIAEVLRLMRDNRWQFQGTIEFEYPVPAGSDPMAEMAKCMKFCRDALA